MDKNEITRTRTYSWEDPAIGATAAKTMAGIDYLKAMAAGILPLPALLHTLGLEVGEIEQGVVSFRFQPAEFHYNPLGTVHGGVITSVLDSAMGCTLQSVLEAGAGYTTLEIKVNFLKAVRVATGTLRASGKIIHVGKSTALLEAQLTDAAGAVYAHSVSTCMILRD